MYKALLTGCLIVTSLSSWAMSLVDDQVELKFCKDHKEIAHAIPTEKLIVMREEIKFPKGRQFTKLDLAIELLEEIINSDEFKEKVIGYTRPNRATAASDDMIREYQKNYLWRETDKKLTNEDIYKIIMQGNEKMRPETLGEMNINIKKYKSPWWNINGRKVVGWTNPGSSKWINVNWRFYDNYDVHQMVGNIVHEWIHLLGFLHGNVNMREEVPYVVGKIAATIAKEKLENNDYSGLLAQN